MKTIKNIFSWAGLLMLMWGTGYGQTNYLYNGGFELGQYQDAFNASTNLTTKHYTSDYLNTWVRAKNSSGTVEHSPDWCWFDNPSFSNGQHQDDGGFGNPDIPFYAHEGYGMIGMGVGEMITQQYDLSGLLPILEHAINKELKISYWIRIPSSMAILPGTELNFYLAKKHLEYTTDDFCQIEYQWIGNNSNQWEEVFSDNDMKNKYPSGAWHYVEHTFTVPEDIEDYPWLAFHVRSYEEVPPCDGTLQYLFIDDVKLEFPCEKGCYGTTTMPNPLISGTQISANGAFRISGLDNVTEVELHITTTNGQPVYSTYASCPNGFDHDLFWIGQNGNYADLANAGYRYSVVVRNECFEKRLEGGLSKVQNYTGSQYENFADPCGTGPNITPEACCLYDLHLNYEDLQGSGYSEYIIIDNIWASTANPTFSDEVQIQSNANVLFQAGKQITLCEGFNTEDGAVFLAQIEDCSAGGGGGQGHGGGGEKWNTGEEETQPDKLNQGQENGLSGEGYLRIFPNPASDHCFVEVNYPDVDVVPVTVSDMFGRVLLRTELKSTERRKIDLSGMPAGMYRIAVMVGDQRVSKGVVKQ